MPPTKGRDPLWKVLPKKVWVGSYEFSLVVCRKNDPRLEGNNGLTILDETFVIYFDPGVKGTLVVEIVLHELTHALNFVVDIDDGVLEETIADKHGRGWAAFWLANPKMLSWLVQAMTTIRSEQQS